MKYATLGELMLRLSTPGYSRFVQAKSFDVNYGGGEANVALALCNLGEEAMFISKFPQNEIGDAARNSLREYGVDTTGILRGGERLGIYYLETGDSVRPSKVIYDRAHSSISEAKASEFNFKKLFTRACGTSVMPYFQDIGLKLICRKIRANPHGKSLKDRPRNGHHGLLRFELPFEALDQRRSSGLLNPLDGICGLCNRQ